MKVNPAYTSKVCARCGKEGRLERLKFICSCGVYDRDYNGSLNVAKNIPGRFPSRLVRMEGKALIGFISLSKLLAWLSVVETS